MKIVSTDDFSEKLESLSLKQETHEQNEALGIKYAILSCVFFGFTSFHIKTVKILYEESFNANIFMFWRSLSSSIIGYLVAKYKSESILGISRIKSKFWFGVRTFFNYISMITLTLCMVELRAATASCMSSMSPAVMVILSIIILGEKFQIRYLTGILICFIGSAMIVMNEKKPNPVIEEVELIDGIEDIEKIEEVVTETTDLIKGVFYGVYHIIFNSLCSVAQKILANEKIPVETQTYYIGLTNYVVAIIVAFYTGIDYIDFSFGGYSSLNGIFFYLCVHYMNESLKNIPLAKFTPFFYIGTLTVFVCGVVFIGESLFFTDIIGSLLILSFNVYNSYYPIKN